MTYSSTSDKFNGSSYDSACGEVGSKESAWGAAGGRWPPHRACGCGNAQPASGKLTAAEAERAGGGREHLLLHPRSTAQARQSEGETARNEGWQKGSLKTPPEALQFRGSGRSPGPWQKPHPFGQAKASGLHCRERLGLAQSRIYIYSARPGACPLLLAPPPLAEPLQQWRPEAFACLKGCPRSGRKPLIGRGPDRQSSLW